MPKAFIVSCEIETLVVAENEEAARLDGKIAIAEAAQWLQATELDAIEAMRLPDGWQKDDYVHGAKDMKALDALKLNEGYRRKLEEFKLAKMGQGKLFNENGS